VRRLPDEAMAAAAAAAAISVSSMLFCTGVISPPLSMIVTARSKSKRFFALQGKDHTYDEIQAFTLKEARSGSPRCPITSMKPRDQISLQGWRFMC
jgi:hypothetical protein